MPGVGDAVLPCVDGDVALRVHHRHLPTIVMRVSLKQRVEGVLRGHPSPHQIETARPVVHEHERLGGHSAHAGFGPRHDGSD